MTFVNTRLDECVAYGFTGGPEWSTLVVALENGHEQRNGRWLYPKHRYSAQYMNLKNGPKQILLAAFVALRGQLHVCRFKDWNDYTAQSEGDAWEPLLAPVAGTMTPAQLFKRYSLGSQSTDRIIQAPVPDTVTVFRNGVPVTVTVDYETGLVTPSANWVAGTYTWNGEHDVWVRFENDFNAFTIGSWQSNTADISLVEVRR